MDMDCSFDAPMFVDFQNMEGEDQKREEAEAYFEIRQLESVRVGFTVRPLRVCFGFAVRRLRSSGFPVPNDRW